MIGEPAIIRVAVRPAGPGRSVVEFEASVLRDWANIPAAAAKLQGAMLDYCHNGWGVAHREIRIVATLNVENGAGIMTPQVEAVDETAATPGTIAEGPMVPVDYVSTTEIVELFKACRNDRERDDVFALLAQATNPGYLALPKDVAEKLHDMERSRAMDEAACSIIRNITMGVGDYSPTEVAEALESLMRACSYKADKMANVLHDWL